MGKGQGKAKRKMGGKWSGRAAQLAVKYYKDLGGKYEGAKSKSNSLTSGTDQKVGLGWRKRSGPILTEESQKIIVGRAESGRQSR